jgi:hypothetical protein
MQLAPFAAREARVNAATIRHLANALAVYTPAGGVAFLDPVPVIFDAAYVTIDDKGVASSHPAVTIDLVNVPTPKQGDTYELNGTTYAVVEPMADGTGMAVQRLRKA